MKVTLKAARINANLTQDEAASLIGVSSRSISLWESGKTYPSVEKIPGIERAYGVTYADIIFLPTDIGITEVHEG